MISVTERGAPVGPAGEAAVVVDGPDDATGTADAVPVAVNATTVAKAAALSRLLRNRGMDTKSPNYLFCSRCVAP
ncbi:hypothetical protein ACWCPM_19865 [Streptomyces sp. NPDC002309]